MTYPYDASTLAAEARLLSFYNGNDYDAGTNTGGFGAGGHRTNFIPALQDVAIVGASVSDAADAAADSAIAAASSAGTAATLAAALTGTSTTSQAIGTGAKTFVTQSGKSFDVGSNVLIKSDASPTSHYMQGVVTSYSGTSLTVLVSTISGSGTRADWTILGRTGSPGLTGATGATGAAGQTIALKWTFGASVADADPGAGILLINNATYSSATSLYVDNVDVNGASQTTFLDAMDDSTHTALRGTIYLQQIDDPTKYAVFNVTGVVTDGTGYRKIAVTHVMSNGTFTAGHELGLLFARTGDKGADGAGAGNVISDIGSVVDQRLVIFNGTTGTHVTTASFGIGTSGAAIGALSTNNSWGGNQTFSASLIGGADFLLSNDITPAQITSNQDNYAPTGIATASVLRLSSDAVRSISGITSGANGRMLFIRNVGSFPITLLNDTTSTAGNRFLLGADYTVSMGQCVTLMYDNTLQRWVPISPINLAGVGSVTRPSYAFAADPNTGMFNVSADVLGFAVGGGEALNLSVAGASITASTASTGLYITGNAVPTIRFDPSSGDTVNGRLYQSGDVLSISDGATARLNLTLTSGLLELPAGQLKFPATQNPSSDPNTLDDYEEGNFTPVLAFGGASVGITYGLQLGKYVKIGKVVYFNLYISLTSQGSSVGIASIAGLPFTIEPTIYTTCALYTQNMFFSSGGQYDRYALFDIASPTLYLYENLNDNTQGGATIMTDGYFTDSAQIGISGHYFIT